MLGNFRRAVLNSAGSNVGSAQYSVYCSDKIGCKEMFKMPKAKMVDNFA